MYPHVLQRTLRDLCFQSIVTQIQFPQCKTDFFRKIPENPECLKEVGKFVQTVGKSLDFIRPLVYRSKGPILEPPIQLLLQVAN